jgi:hypothetical protein
MKRNTVVFTAICILAGLVLIVSIGGSGKADQPQPVSKSSAPQYDVEKELARAQKTKLWHKKLLDEAVGGDEEGKMLTSFMMDKAQFVTKTGRMLNPLIITYPSKGNGAIPDINSGFRVYPSSFGDRRHLRVRELANWQFEPDRNLLMIPSRLEWTYTRLWAGVIFAHELRHVYDKVTGLEQRSRLGSEVWLLGEMRAYTLEIRLLNLATNGKFAKELEKLSSSYAGGKWIWPTDAEVMQLNKLFKSIQSKSERFTRNTLYMVALNFTLAEQHSLGEAGKRQALSFIHKMNSR